MTSSIYPVAFVVNTPTINANTNILSTPITITSEQVSPGGGGILRLNFSFDVTTNSMMVSVFDGAGTTLIGNLNADNDTAILSDGYYRFDIDVEAGDTINLHASEDITTVNHFRAHLVQFGA